MLDPVAAIDVPAFEPDPFLRAEAGQSGEHGDWREPGVELGGKQGAVVFRRFDKNDPEGGSPCDYGGPRLNAGPALLLCQ